MLLQEFRDKFSTIVRVIRPVDTELFDQLLAVMNAQVQWKTQVNNITAFRIRRSKLNKIAIVLQLKRLTSSKWLTVSWRAGCLGYRPCTYPLQSAFRQAIYYQIKNWKRQAAKPKCQYCSSREQLQVDHVQPSFSELTKQFLSSVTKAEIPLVFNYQKFGGRSFRRNNRQFRIQWCKYHKTNSTFQWLCKPCNQKKH